MNIFILDQSPVLSAQYQCDRHVGNGKMFLEAVQILCTVWHSAADVDETGPVPYRSTHKNHPCTVWARQTPANYAWLIEHAQALSDEYTFRSGKVHKSVAAFEYCKNRFLAYKSSPFETNSERTGFVLAMPDEFKVPDPVSSYRNYYRGAKSSIAVWAKGRPAPEWWAAP